MGEDFRAQAIPLAAEERTRFLRARFATYFEGLIDRIDDPTFLVTSPEVLSEETARSMAWSLALGDLLALLGRTGERSFRVQLASETGTVSVFKLEA
jgi:hypothetical protein